MNGYKIKKDFIVQKMGDKSVVFDSEKSILHTLNETASYMYQKLRIGWTDAKIVAILKKKYSLDANQIEKDLDSFKDELIAKGFLEKTK